MEVWLIVSLSVKSAFMAKEQALAILDLRNGIKIDSVFIESEKTDMGGNIYLELGYILTIVIFIESVFIVLLVKRRKND